MASETHPVMLLRQKAYHRPALKEAIERICRRLDFRCPRGSRVLLKPNLVTARGHDGLACTHPELVAAAAEWFLDQGAAVRIGDSPAFGTARGVMTACGISAAVADLPVTLVNFNQGESVSLASGRRVTIAREALDCDFLINLPKIKAHGQLLVSLAVKNYFGSVLGWRKPYLHMRCGGGDGAGFAALLVELPGALPAGISLLDGITAMHRTGPVQGSPLSLGVLAGALEPAAADTGLLLALAIEPVLSPTWRECRKRELPGSLPEQLVFPFLGPEAFHAARFELPLQLAPVRFQAGRLLQSGLKKMTSA
jgi:uncharacterized protein (DUF362 family)